MVKLFDAHWLPWLQSIWPDPASWHYFVFVGDPLADNCFEAFGVLTSGGLFVSIGVVLPAILIFYLMMTVLEDSGYLPRLAVLVDSVLHRIGLHGYAIVPAILGLGCNVPAVTATRILETRKQRFIMMSLLAIFIPCGGAQLGVMLEVIPRYGRYGLPLSDCGLLPLWIYLKQGDSGRKSRDTRGCATLPLAGEGECGKETPEPDKELPERGCALCAFRCAPCEPSLSGGGVIQALAAFFEPLFVTWFGVPKETVGPLIAAFLRKDLAIAQLSVIPMTAYQMFASVVLISIYFPPCVATFVVMLREGWKELCAALAVLLVVVFAYGGLIHAIGILLGVA